MTTRERIVELLLTTLAVTLAVGVLAGGLIYVGWTLCEEHGVRMERVRNSYSVKP